MSSGIASGLAPRVVRDMLESLTGPKEHAAFDATALRMRSAPAREVLAWLASGGLAGLDAVLSIAHVAMRDPASVEASRWRSFDPAVASRLARLFAMQDIFAGDRRDAHAIYQAIVKVHGPRYLPRRHVNSALQVALCIADYAAAVALLELLPKESYEHRYALCDLANPFSGSPHASMERWLARVNQILWERRVEPVGVASIDPFPFDGLACDLAAGTVEGPLVTIAISSWCPDASLISAVGSIVNQTWRNLEILLVDDGSPADYDAILAAAVDLDPERIRLLRQERNGGTYVARNRALAEASGEYFTVHDSDDWAHPSRIERQVAMLRADKGLVANYCTGLRADDNLLVSLPGVPAFRTNESSLLFRRAPVMDAIGYYDPSRKGADTEFSTRLRLHFGEKRIAVLPDILTFIRLSKGSLSRAELRPGWRHPARAMYRRSFEAWHGRNSNITIRTPDPAEQKFPRPSRFQSVPRAGAALDIAFLSDYRLSSPGAEQTSDEIAVIAESQRRVAIIQQDLFTNLTPLAVEPYDVQVQDLLQRQAVEEIDLGGHARVGTLVVTQPALLTYMTLLRSSIDVDRVLLLEDTAAQSGAHAGDDRSLSERACRVIFGLNPLWIPREPANGSATPVADRRWPRAVAPRHWRTPARESVEPREPVLGVEIPPAGRLQPWLDRLAKLHERPVLAWATAGGRDADGLPAPWTVYDRAIALKPTYLALVDFWIDPTPPEGASSPPTGVLQAMAAGCIPILDPGWRLQFGQAAVYAAPSHLARVIQTLGSSPQLRRRTLEHGPAFVDRHAGPAAFGNRVRALST
ncbi:MULTISPECIES: glycosyltransferase family A protein [unclassified Luteimonas]